MNKKSKILIVVGTYRQFKRWGVNHPKLAGKFLPAEKRFTKAINVNSEISATKVLTLENIEDMVILDKSVAPHLDLLQKKIAVLKLQNR